jgi:UDP-GlcNAc3NAcA epimerase
LPKVPTPDLTLPRTRRIVTVLGARPQFIKAFPLSKLFHTRPGFEEIVVHTGQHFDANMSDVFFAELEMKAPAYSLGIHGGGQAAVTGRMLGAIEDILVSERPAAVLVYGDTNSTLAGGLAAVKTNIPVVHVESGLRSFNRRMPEEINRVVVDHLSSLLLCPTSNAANNLASEGITGSVHRVGDVMFDIARWVAPMAREKSSVLERLGLQPRTYGAATFHRNETLNSRLRVREIVDYLHQQAAAIPLILPMHPHTREVLSSLSITFDPAVITITEPLGYLDMYELVRLSSVVLTDSGGLQREAYFHRVPCITLRDETEWVETVESGWNRLWTEPDYQPRREIPDYERIDVAGAIFDVLDRFLPV